MAIYAIANAITASPIEERVKMRSKRMTCDGILAIQWPIKRIRIPLLEVVVQAVRQYVCGKHQAIAIRSRYNR
jgi:hypothetical protein